MNKKCLILTTAALLAASSQSFAEGVYVSGNFGYTDSSDEVFNDGANGAGNPKSPIDSGIKYGVAVGFEIMPALNVEVEYSIASYSTDSSLSMGSGARALDSFGIDATLDVDMLTVNGSYEFGNSSIVTPYLEGGLGVTFYDMDGGLYVGSFGGTDGGGFLPATFNYKGDGSEFTYFVGVGISVELSEQVDVTIGYRYADLGEVATEYDSNGDRLQTDMTTNNLQAGVKYHF